MIMRVLFIFGVMLLSAQVCAQKYITEKADISFFSEAPIENIKATTSEASSLIDLATGEFAFSVPIKSFTFRKSLMKKHFNENYMDSEKYPKATFKGTLKNYQTTPGSYRAIAIGELTIHGRKNKVEIEGDLVVTDKSVEINAVFPVALKDHNIKIPKILFSNIAEIVEVTVAFQYKPYAPN